MADDDDWMSPKKARKKKPKKANRNGRYKNIDDKPYETNRGPGANTGQGLIGADRSKGQIKRAKAEQKRIAMKKRIFLEHFGKTGAVAKSAQVAGWTSATVRHHRELDPEFEDAYQEAYQLHADSLEIEANRRAVEGDADVVVQAGKVVYHVDPETGEYLRDPLTGEPIPIVRRTKSDKLLETLLRAKRPEQFRENVQVDHKVSGGVLVVGAIGKPSPQAEARGLTFEEEMAEQQAKYRSKDVAVIENPPQSEIK